MTSYASTVVLAFLLQITHYITVSVNLVSRDLDVKQRTNAARLFARIMENVERALAVVHHIVNVNQALLAQIVKQKSMVVPSTHAKTKEIALH